MWRFTGVALLTMLVSSVGLAGVSRVGNQSIGSEEDGFETTLPATYPKTSYRGEFLVLESPGAGSIGKSTDILAYTVMSFVPEWKSHSRAEWVRELEEFSSFIDFVDNPDSCVLAARWVNSKDQVFGVATWGDGRGVIFSSDGTALTWSATEHMLKNISLYEGACQWN